MNQFEDNEILKTKPIYKWFTIENENHKTYELILGRTNTRIEIIEHRIDNKISHTLMINVTFVCKLEETKEENFKKEAIQKAQDFISKKAKHYKAVELELIQIKYV